MKKADELPGYFREYLEEKFIRVEDKISEIKRIIDYLKTETQTNHECMTSVKVALEDNTRGVGEIKPKLKLLFYMIAGISTILIVHFIQTGYLHGDSIVKLMQGLFAWF